MLTMKDKVKLFQVALGSYPDGVPLESTWDAAYRYLMSAGVIPEAFPYAVKQWGCKVMFTKALRVNPFDAKGEYSVKDFTFCISGSFTYPSGKKPCSILVSDNQVIYPYACHYFQGKPETVLYILEDGSYGMKLCKTTEELPKNTVAAIGGGQIMRDGKQEFMFEEEGFTGIYSDVRRTTSHCAVGFDKYGYAMAVYHHRCSLADMQRRCSNIGMVDGVFIDGGHISAINADELQSNIYQDQGYMIQF